MDSNWSSGRKNRIWRRRVEVELAVLIENTQVVDSTWGQKGEKRENGESLYKSVQKVRSRFDHFPALFFRQFALCVAEILALAAALIFRFFLPTPLSAAIAPSIPFSFFTNWSRSFFSMLTTFIGEILRRESYNTKGPKVWGERPRAHLFLSSFI
jgi:hypothetical protein